MWLDVVTSGGVGIWAMTAGCRHGGGWCVSWSRPRDEMFVVGHEVVVRNFSYLCPHGVTFVGRPSRIVLVRVVKREDPFSLPLLLGKCEMDY